MRAKLLNIKHIKPGYGRKSGVWTFAVDTNQLPAHLMQVLGYKPNTYAHGFILDGDIWLNRNDRYGQLVVEKHLFDLSELHRYTYDLKKAPINYEKGEFYEQEVGNNYRIH